ncbi:hypothetical protein JHK84_050148 [Glycine max]|nr:hypothetical protein JHK86_050091 [Glycine max]KAG5094560.1 hypothetical protein JHK84_050148 [Glycine max]
MFTLLVFMCFGGEVQKEKIEDIEHVQRCLMSELSRFGVLNLLPGVVTRVLLRKRWQELLDLRQAQKDVFTQLIKTIKNVSDGDGGVICYVDTLLKLQLPEENRKLDEGEVVALCSEFLTAGTDTTCMALEWVMANIVKYTHVQKRVVEEIKEVLGDRKDKEVKEEDLNKLPYLKDVILEGLRRHDVTEDVIFEMGRDPRVWEDPMEFKPERFLSSGFEAFDIIGSKKVKMMPFGAGRRACPPYNLAMFHLEYFVAKLVWNFEWKASSGGNVDLSRKQEFTMVMKHPLHAQIYPRF